VGKVSVSSDFTVQTALTGRLFGSNGAGGVAVGGDGLFGVERKDGEDCFDAVAPADPRARCFKGDAVVATSGLELDKSGRRFRVRGGMPTPMVSIYFKIDGLTGISLN